MFEGVRDFDMKTPLEFSCIRNGKLRGTPPRDQTQIFPIGDSTNTRHKTYDKYRHHWTRKRVEGIRYDSFHPVGVIHIFVQIWGKDSYVQQGKQYTKQYKNTEYTKQKTNLQNKKIYVKRILKNIS